MVASLYLVRTLSSAPTACGVEWDFPLAPFHIRCTSLPEFDLHSLAIAERSSPARARYRIVMTEQHLLYPDIPEILSMIAVIVGRMRLG